MRWGNVLFMAVYVRVGERHGKMWLLCTLWFIFLPCRLMNCNLYSAFKHVGSKSHSTVHKAIRYCSQVAFCDRTLSCPWNASSDLNQSHAALAKITLFRCFFNIVGDKIKQQTSTYRKVRLWVGHINIVIITDYHIWHGKVTETLTFTDIFCQKCYKHS